uniref:Uncharacterized protein n=1 Tax=Plectus sambesii TaxID=2011161 RepID=A0A914UHB8_9BILA
MGANEADCRVGHSSVHRRSEDQQHYCESPRSNAHSNATGESVRKHDQGRLPPPPPVRVKDLGRGEKAVVPRSAIRRAFTPGDIQAPLTIPLKRHQMRFRRLTG